MDVFHKIAGFLDHHRYAFGALLITCCLAGWLVGCQPTTSSIIDPQKQVTASEMDREIILIQRDFDQQLARIGHETQLYNSKIASANEMIEVAEADIEAKLALRKQIVEVVGGLGVAAAEGTISPASAVGSIVQLLLAGLVVGGTVDTVRKNRVIKRLKNGAATSTAEPVP